MTPSPDETRHLRLLAESGAAIVDGVARELPGWVERQVIHDLGALGDEGLAPLHFAWGVAKAGVLRARADAPLTGP